MLILLPVTSLAAGVQSPAARAAGGLRLSELVGADSPVFMGELVKSAKVGADAPSRTAAASPSRPQTATVFLQQELAHALAGSDITPGQIVAGSAAASGPQAVRLNVETASEPAPAEIIVRAVPADSSRSEALLPEVSTPDARVPTNADGSSHAVRREVMVLVQAEHNQLKFSPQALELPDLQSGASFQLDPAVAANVQIFVRDPSWLVYDPASRRLTSKKAGVSEIYFVFGGKLHILPITVSPGGERWDLKVPEALVSIEGLVGKPQTSALFADSSVSKSAPVLSVTADQTQVDDLAVAARVAGNGFFNPKVDLNYQTIRVQLIDDRSAPAANRIFPVSGVKVHVAGTEFIATSDARGIVHLKDIPEGARLLLRIDDPSGTYVPAISELAVQAGQEQYQIRVVRTFMLSAFETVTGNVQHAELGTFCGSVLEGEKPGVWTRESGVVTLDVQADGPYYFNRFGYLDQAATTLGSDGRFCFLNIPAGPVALTVFDSEAQLATFPIGVHSGRHVEEELEISRGMPLSVRLAALPSSHEQLSGDRSIAESIRTVEMIDLIPFGSANPMSQAASGLVEAADPVVGFKGRQFVYLQASEFEPMVYGLDKMGRETKVVPMIPRGFIEDMAIYAQSSHDPMLGSVYVEYNHAPGVSRDSINLRLFNLNSQDVGDGWYFGDVPLTKAVFFNVPAGQYGILAETRDGHWLGISTVVVYNETVSYVRLGGTMAFHRDAGR